MNAARLYAEGAAVHTTVKVDGTSVDLEDLMTLTAQGAVTLHTMTYQPTRSRTRWHLSAGPAPGRRHHRPGRCDMPWEGAG